MQDQQPSPSDAKRSSRSPFLHPMNAKEFLRQEPTIKKNQPVVTAVQPQTTLLTSDAEKVMNDGEIQTEAKRSRMGKHRRSQYASYDDEGFLGKYTSNDISDAAVDYELKGDAEADQANDTASECAPSCSEQAVQAFPPAIYLSLPVTDAPGSPSDPRYVMAKYVPEGDLYTEDNAPAAVQLPTFASKTTQDPSEQPTAPFAAQPIAQEQAAEQPSLFVPPQMVEPTAPFVAQPIAQEQAAEQPPLFVPPQMAEPAASFAAQPVAQEQAAEQPSLFVPPQMAEPAAPFVAQPIEAVAMPNEGDISDESDENEAAEDAIPSNEMAQPVPVPSGEATVTQKKSVNKKTILFAAVSGLVVLLFVVWQSGILNRGSSAKDAVPASGQTVEATALSSVASNSDTTPLVRSFTVSNQQATAPADVVFAVTSNALVSQLQLMNDSGRALDMKAYSAQQGSDLAWTCTVRFLSPYKGVVHLYLSDSEGFWSDSGLALELDIQ
ncbi:MAG: hypothetical protein PHI98_11170 [Eubacteriales bacterium]|nr:hypothetical protein [Eubacteriales bacterium]